MPPEHEPKEIDKYKVIAWAGAGYTHETMAYHLGIDPKTLRKHYEAELSQGKELAHAAVAGQLFILAMSGDFQAMRFWLQAQAKWTTKHEVDVKTKLSFSDFVAQYSEEDLEADDDD